MFDDAAIIDWFFDINIIHLTRARLISFIFRFFFFRWQSTNALGKGVLLAQVIAYFFKDDDARRADDYVDFVDGHYFRPIIISCCHFREKMIIFPYYFWFFLRERWRVCYAKWRKCADVVDSFFFDLFFFWLMSDFDDARAKIDRSFHFHDAMRFRYWSLIDAICIIFADIQTLSSSYFDDIADISISINIFFHYAFTSFYYTDAFDIDFDAIIKKKKKKKKKKAWFDFHFDLRCAQRAKARCAARADVREDARKRRVCVSMRKVREQRRDVWYFRSLSIDAQRAQTRAFLLLFFH